MQPELIEITDPGYYIIKDDKLIPVQYYDEDREDALRILALRIHLEDFTSPMTVDDNCRITVNSHQKAHGTSPDEAMERCRILRKALAEAADVVPVRVPDTNGTGVDFSRVNFHTTSVNTLRSYGYNALANLLKNHNREACSTEILNSICFLTGDDSDLSKTMAECWDGCEVQDRRTYFQTQDSEWLVLTDDEADQRWDEELNYYIDECLELPANIRPYFDDEKWKRDARMDGRGHALGSYNGTEDSVYLESEDETFYLFRTN